MSEPWKGNKRQREALRQRFGGRCAYCGGDLTDMHADHLEPVIRVQTDPWGRRLPAAECWSVKPERNVVANMMPACKGCNLHKGGYSLEGWRDILQRSAEIVAKQTSTFRAGVRLGVISVSAEPVRFYFERLATTASAVGIPASCRDEPKRTASQPSQGDQTMTAEQTSIDRRINELLETTSRYLQRARDAEAALKIALAANDNPFSQPELAHLLHLVEGGNGGTRPGGAFSAEDVLALRIRLKGMVNGSR